MQPQQSGLDSVLPHVLGDDDASPPETHDGYHSSPRWGALERVLSAQVFVRAPRLSAFLRYVGERSLLDRTHEITEQQIGIHVFGRPADYSPGEDNIVRHTARQLRQRLALFYQEEGRDEQIQIVMPRGGYILHFLPSSDTVDTPAEDSVPQIGPAFFPESDPLAPRLPAAGLSLSGYEDRTAQPSNSAPPGRVGNHLRFLAWWLGGVALTLVLVSLLGIYSYRAFHLSETDRLWQAIFQPGKRTIVVPGDAGLNLYYNLSGGEIVSTQDYAAKSYLARPAAQLPLGHGPPFADRRYTTMSDVNLIVHVLRLSEASAGRVELRFARAIRADDLKDGNALLIGGPSYNPWVNLFDRNVDFRFVYGTDIDVINKAPRAGEAATYSGTFARTHSLESERPMTGYSLICLTDNLQKSGRVLMVEGKSMDDIEAASDFLTDRQDMQPVVRRALQRDNRLANFDLLLETTFIKGGSLSAKAIAIHVHPNRP
jgi:hypothetical protein